jgi:hypothetical protein
MTLLLNSMALKSFVSQANCMTIFMHLKIIILHFSAWGLDGYRV